MENNTALRSEFEAVRREYPTDSPSRFIGRTALRAIVWDKSLGKCWYCGREMNPFRDFSVDHLIPESKGGGGDYDNLVPCCRSCNGSKGGRTLEEFRKTLARKTVGYPGFLPEQEAWLREQGFDRPIPHVSNFKFYFEEK